MPHHESPFDLLELPVQFLKGVGPKRGAALEDVGIRTLRDLLFYVPRRYLDRTAIVRIAELRHIASGSGAAGGKDPEGINIRQDYTIVGDVRSFRMIGARGRSRFVLVLGDETGTMQCVWFGGVQYWKSAFRIGELLAVSGQPSMFAGVLQIVHPDIDRITSREDNETVHDDIDWAALLNTGGLVPLYPSGQELQKVGLDSAGFRRILHAAVHRYTEKATDIVPRSVVARHGLDAFGHSLRAVHFPSNNQELRTALRRLKYEELFLFQLKLALRRRLQKDEMRGIVFDVKSVLARTLVDALPYRLTNAQTRVVREITADMASQKPMNRLLQGDVGCGKTVVALLAMLIAVDNEYQAAFLAPTEILAEQHSRTLAAMLVDLPVCLRLLTGSARSKQRKAVLEETRDGRAHIIVGTHALLESDVAFARLGLVVIDEQHRFGVMQRAALREKGPEPDVLVMTATPIPRTLSLTVFGDLDISVIDELPKNRKPIATSVAEESRKESVYAFVRKEVRKGRQAYFVYPLIEESERIDLKAATLHFVELQQKVFPELRLALLHGRMSGEEKEGVMKEFLRGDVHILVATTVIEVGIDVANATVMVIEDADRFGLSQLHQLRGRVGRGAEQSYCILMTRRWIAERVRRRPDALRADAPDERQAEQRLSAMVATTDGFKIAEMDLQLRGPGDFFGTRQSGMPEFRVADIVADASLLDIAREDAFRIVAEDPTLSQAEHRALGSFASHSFGEELKLMRIG